MRLINNVVRKLAQASLSEGVFYEPRMYYDRLLFPASTSIVRSDPGVFRNNEKFPVRITDMIIYMSPPASIATEADLYAYEKNLYRFSLLLQGLNTDYMAPAALPLSAWANKQTAAPLYISQGAAAWKFAKPFILCQRDSLVVEGNPVFIPLPDQQRNAYVGFQGVGVETGRPYVMDSQFTVDVNTPVGLFTFNPDDYRNPGVEPIAIESMMASYTGGLEQSSAIGSILDIGFNVRQLGNGTNAPWFQGPVTIPALTACPGPMLAVSTGRSIVHHFPTSDEDVQGMIWEPGQGFKVEISSTSGSTDNAGLSFDVAFAGYLMVT